MLVLKRQEGEKVIIDVPPSNEARRVIVKVCEVRRRDSAVRLGFEAAGDIVIDREEVAERRVREAQGT